MILPQNKKSMQVWIRTVSNTRCLTLFGAMLFAFIVAAPAAGAAGMS